MVRVITQETFNEVVKENIEELDLTPEEAVEEATAQFEAQGVDLSNIIKDLALSGDNHLVAHLQEQIGQGAADDVITDHLQLLKIECEKDLAHRVKVAKDGAYSILIKLLKARQKIYADSKSDKDREFMILVLNILDALMDVQPDLLDEQGVDFIISTLKNTEDASVLSATLQWASTCCLMHEGNRQTLFNKGIADSLHDLIKDQKNTQLLSSALSVVRRLTLDDDVRVQCGRAHDHARLMGTRLLEPLAALLDEHTKPPLVSQLMLTMASLLVRNELCASAAHCAHSLQRAMADNCDNAAVAQQAYKLIAALAGNDDVKRLLMSSDLPFIIVSALDRHLGNPATCALGLKCVSALCLREKVHSERMAQAGAAEAVVQCLERHKEDANVQKNACWAIRNMVARYRELRDKFLELGVEPMLNEAYKKFNKDFGFDIKSALRDLECDVKLDEQWKGRGVQIDN